MKRSTGPTLLFYKNINSCIRVFETVTTRINLARLFYEDFSNMNDVFLSDVDECAIGTHSCSTDATCVNNVGSFTCCSKTSGNSTASITSK